MKNYLSYYFHPKRFEYHNGESIYSYLGVKFFKKYLLFTDLVIFRIGNKKQLKTEKVTLKDEVQRLLWQTYRDEVIHLIFMLIIGLFIFTQNTPLSLSQWVAIFFINLFANIYPIFVQRHNRMRYIRLLTSLQSKKLTAD